ncbi:hypothetical protein [Paenibacillus borealis]|uniref:Uncharacterized protein n=1 Tax=Paenibacillus borealis TaxID=160799 RepID=A0A089L7W9_PAEBO|nr:hypothetical protein [Paenibacillus borealis]AIQ56180.1 hypothetical protein PBOR_03820 [Paenibacillus borealis]
MWLKSVLWYLLYYLKYLAAGALVSAIVAIFFPPAALVIMGIMLLGGLPAAYKDLKEKRVPVMKAKQINKRYAKLKNEFEGFEEALRLTKRNM